MVSVGTASEGSLVGITKGGFVGGVEPGFSPSRSSDGKQGAISMQLLPDPGTGGTVGM